MTSSLTRRSLVLGAAAATLLAACATNPSGDALPPIVFVHGDSDSAAAWITTVWRFESNGWPRERLHAIDVPYSRARDDDTKPQEGRSGTSENMQFLSAEVDRVLKATGARQVVLVALSRGGFAVRNYIANGGGAAKVSHAILGGTPNHGVWADVNLRPNSEYNGTGPFLTALNAPKGSVGDEVAPGVKWMTIRSDSNDVYAQPDGVWIGAKGTPTHVSYEGPALKGAENIVFAGIDHRETALSAKAFETMFRFITGRAAATLAITPEPRVMLDGKLSGFGYNNAAGMAPSNLPLVGATLEVYAVNSATGERNGAAVHRKTIGADGAWGPFTADVQASYEFVISGAAGYAITHIYRSPFARSSNIVNLRADRLLDADKTAVAIVTMTRPRGYFGLPRNQISLDGQSPPGVPPGTAGVWVSKLRVTDAAGRAVVGVFDDERIVGRAWPAANNELTLLELLY